ncbi:hypothetical protein OWR29_06495 [Actinoplanes sp. Pm04-4]|uniref:Uncharacterized protein n=1 Tax=Paractinoplanes pyxinae TaxID=2997416 RepID=A0ABT4ATV1_9ACTN|nr:hypothetical protein [Actinoplanes pyxinae]MCY1137644.1 hypothetical protein [Actinoplanes pyxinae]
MSPSLLEPGAAGNASGMMQSAVARFVAGRTISTLAVTERLATAPDVGLKVVFEPRGEAA